MKTKAGNKTWLWGSGVEGAIQMPLYWYDGYQPYEIFLKRNWKCHWPFSVFAKQREWASVHVSRSQSAFLWLLHYETTPPPSPHNGGEGGRLPDESQSLQAFWSTAESRKSRKFFLVESGIHLTIGIWNPDSTDKESEIQVYTDKKSGIQYLECGSCRLESRIQDFLGLPYMGWPGTPFTKRAPRISICWPRNLRYSLLKPFPDYGLTNQSLLASTNKSVYLYCDL